MADRNKVLGTKTSISDRKFLRKSSNLHSSGFLYYDVSFQSCFYHKKRYRQSHRGENEEICQRMSLSNATTNRGMLINRVKKYLFQFLSSTEENESLWEQIFRAAIKTRSQIRSNRTYERKTKYTRRRHHTNRKLC